MEPQMLAQLEAVCESLYKSADPQERQQSEQARARAAAPLSAVGEVLRRRCAPRARARLTRLRTWLPRPRQMLRPFGTNTEYIPQCKAILDATSNART